MSDDHRLVDDDSLQGVINALTAATTVGREQLVGYSVLYRDALVTVVGFKRRDGIVPLAVVLPESVWLDVPHMTDDHGPTKAWS